MVYSNDWGIFVRLFMLAAAISTSAQAQLANPDVKPTQEPKVETRFGITTNDPYRWMEVPARKADMVAYVRSLSDSTTAQLAKLPQRAAFAATLEEATRTGTRFTDVQAHGDKLFYRRLDPADRIAKLMVRDASGERLIFDPGAGGTNAAIGAWSIAPDGKTIAMHISEKGSERGAVRLIEVSTGREVSPRIEPVWGEFGVSWLSPTRMAYTKITAGGADPMLGMRAFVADLSGGGETPILGAGVANAPLVEPSEFPLLLKQTDSDWVLGGAFNARVDQRFFVARRSDLIAGKPRWQSLSTLADQVSNVALHGDNAYLMTSKGASYGRIERRNLKTGVVAAIATPPGMVLVDVLTAADGVYVTAQADGAARLLFAEHGAAALREIALPFESDIAGSATASDGRGIIIGLAGWTTAPRSYRAEGGRLTNLNLDSAGWDATKSFVVHRFEAVSADGTKVPLVVVQPSAAGPWPTILEGYGSYGYPTTTPWYNPFMLSWTSKGGAVAYCGTRGGNERGRDWHDGGRAANKPNAHADYIACAEKLIAVGVAKPGGIAATGTSAGGMLAPIAAQQRPELFGALLPRVAMLNASRLEGSANGPNQYSEMGDPSTAEGYRALIAEDAVVALERAKGIPDTLITIGLNDQRVAPWMGAKFAATARDRFGSKQLVLVRADSEAGHGVGSTRDVQIDEFADVFAFLADRLAANSLK